MSTVDIEIKRTRVSLIYGYPTQEFPDEPKWTLNSDVQCTLYCILYICMNRFKVLSLYCNRGGNGGGNEWGNGGGNGEENGGKHGGWNGG